MRIAVLFTEILTLPSPSKPSRPGRVYVKVKEQPLLDVLSAKVKGTTFKDAKNTINDACLVGPPSLEFAPYNKTPSGRNRHDGRQGTIDQDQEFIDFLQSLTEPITKPATNGTESTEAKQDKTAITPLVQFIKEKKANKAKEKEAAAAAKSSKKNQDGKESKSKGEPRPTIVVKGNAATADKARIAKATQEAVKAANKSAAQIQSKTPSAKTEQKVAKETTPQASPAPKPERQRGNASAASRMIARDLGLAPKEPRTPKAARNVSTANPPATEAATKTEISKAVSSPAPPEEPPSTSKANQSPAVVASAPPTGPKNNRSGQSQQSKVAQQTSQKSGKQTAQLTPGAKSAFLKHANPSQGVTEELLRTTFSGYGEVTRCEIDKKKGLGYIDFTDPEALKKAMAASPVKIGNGQVVVLENRSPYHKRQAQPNTPQQQARAATPSSQTQPAAPSTAASAVTSPQPVPASVDAAEPTTPAAEASTGPASQATPGAPPTAPKGARGGNSAARGARGGANFNQGRGNFNQTPNRGRGGFRNRGRGGRAGTNASGSAAGTGAAQDAPVTTPDTSAAKAGGQSETK